MEQCGGSNVAGEHTLSQETYGSQNPWYTNDQFEAKRVYLRTITRRLQFIQAQVAKGVSRPSGMPVRILDAGCGDGVFLEELCRLPGAEVWGIDGNRLRVERARKACPRAICREADLVQIDPGEWPRFEVILASQVLEHIREDERVLMKLGSMLQGAGLLIVGVPNEGCLLARLRNQVFERIIAQTTDHVNFYTEKAFRKKLDRAGLVIEAALYENFFFPLSRLNAFFSSSDRRFEWMNRLGSLLRSQVAGYYFACRKATYVMQNEKCKLQTAK